MAPIFETTPILNRVIAVVVIALGAAGIGLQSTWFTERSVYVNYSGLVLSVTGLSTVGTGLDICIAGAAIVIVGGVVGLVSSFIKAKNARFIFMAGLVIAAIGGIIELAGGAVVTSSSFYSALGPVTYVYNENRAAQDIPDDSPQQKMELFGLAAFEKCCRPHGWASLGPFGPCGVTCPGPASGNVIDLNLNQFTAIDQSDLCTCVQASVSDTYTSYLNAIGDDQCNVLKQVKVFYPSEINIPTTCERGLCLTLGTVKATLYQNTEIIKAPLIGYQLDAESSGGQAEHGFGFGCGLGYQKGVMWFQEIYHDQSIKPGGSAGLGLGGASFGVVIIGFLLSFFMSRDDVDIQEKDWDKTLAATWNDPAPNSIPVAKVADNSAPPVSAYQVQANDFSDQLLKFYAKHDPNKTQKEIDGIANWGKQNGLAALNKKLHDKYGADLSGGEGGPPV